MRVLAVHSEHPESALIAAAAEAIRNGELVAFPTETVYGLGADALNADAVARIFAAKGRPAWNPVIVHVASVTDAQALVSRWPDDATVLAQALWPGPITFVLPRASVVPDIVTAGLGNVGIRIPSHPVALALLRAAGRPIAAPSANRFTEVSPTSAAHVLRSLEGRVAMLVDGGSCDVGIESTVVDLTGDVPMVLRPGMISRDRIEALLGKEVGYRAADEAAITAEGRAQPSPGTSVRHYAPRAAVWLFETEDLENMQHSIASLQSNATKAPLKARALLIHVRDEAFTTPVERERMPATPDLYGHELYRALHAADAEGIGLLLIELPPRHDVWAAIHDRLTRASR